MKRKSNFFQNYRKLLSGRYAQISLLFLVSLIAHGLFVSRMGFYGDDWSLLWLSYKTGALGSFFPASRFLLTVIYPWLAQVLKPVALEWHVFLFIIRFSSAINLWLLLKALWPEKSRSRLWVSLLFALYPGSLITYQPVTYWWVNLQFSLMFASFWLMLAAVKDAGKRWLLTAVSIIFGLSNLFLSEYLYFLELLRIPILVSYFLYQKKNIKQSLGIIARTAIPFGIAFLIATVVRVVINNQVSSYYKADLASLISTPLAAIPNIITAGFRSGILTWISPFGDAELLAFSGARSLMIFGFISGFTALVIFLFIHLGHHEDSEQQLSIIAIILGLAGLILAGLPFWIANLPIDTGIANYSRFSIPAAFGSALLIYGLISWLFKKSAFMNILLSGLCGAAVMMHLLSGNYFRNIWELQNRFFWELAWRMPSVEAGTTFYSNELPLPTIGENSISAALNWIYMADSDSFDHIDYYAYDTEARFLDEFPREKEIPIKKPHMAGVFLGNSSNLIIYWYQPPACFHVINQAWDLYNPDIPDYLRETAEKFSNNLILPEGKSEAVLRESALFLNENQNNFCYYFQKANLEVENQDWGTVVALWDSAENEELTPNHALERIPFIQGLIHLGQYEEAFNLSLEILDISKNYEPPLCAFWKETAKDSALDKVAINRFITENLACQ